MEFSLWKVLDKIMYERLLSFFNEHKMLFSYQVGFVKSHPAYRAMMLVMDKSNKTLDDGNIVIGISLDFSKAYDMADHDILLFELSLIMVSEIMLGCGSKAICETETTLLHMIKFVPHL